MHRLFVTLSLLVATLVAAPAFAQSDMDLDEPTTREAKAKKKKSLSEVVVREIERGVYLKTNIGTSILVGGRSALLQPGTALQMTIGMDVVDKPKASVAWEIIFDQTLHNGRLEYDQMDSSILGPDRLIQGDVHVFNIMAGVEGSFYPLRRLGIGGRAGGGISLVPLLMDRFYYEQDVVADTWGLPPGATPPVHEGVTGGFFVGPTIEYYTKLSHFSIGIDASFKWVFALDYAIDASAFVKYTF